MSTMCTVYIEHTLFHANGTYDDQTTVKITIKMYMGRVIEIFVYFMLGWKAFEW